MSGSHWSAALDLGLQFPPGAARTGHIMNVYSESLASSSDYAEGLRQKISLALQNSHQGNQALLKRTRKARIENAPEKWSSVYDVLDDEHFYGSAYAAGDVAIVVQDLLSYGDPRAVEYAERLAHSILPYAGEAGGLDHRTRSFVALARHHVLHGNPRTAARRLDRLARDLDEKYLGTITSFGLRSNEAVLNMGSELIEAQDETLLLRTELAMRAATTDESLLRVETDIEQLLSKHGLGAAHTVQLQDRARTALANLYVDRGDIANATRIAARIDNSHDRTTFFTELVRNMRRQRDASAAGGAALK